MHKVIIPLATVITAALALIFCGVSIGVKDWMILYFKEPAYDIEIKGNLGLFRQCTTSKTSSNEINQCESITKSLDENSDQVYCMRGQGDTKNKAVSSHIKAARAFGVMGALCCAAILIFRAVGLVFQFIPQVSALIPEKIQNIVCLGLSLFGVLCVIITIGTFYGGINNCDKSYCTMATDALKALSSTAEIKCGAGSSLGTAIMEIICLLIITGLCVVGLVVTPAPEDEPTTEQPAADSANPNSSV